MKKLALLMLLATGFTITASAQGRGHHNGHRGHHDNRRYERRDCDDRRYSRHDRYEQVYYEAPRYRRQRVVMVRPPLPPLPPPIPVYVPFPPRPRVSGTIVISAGI